MSEIQTTLPESVRLPFEQNAHTITPFFKHMSVFNRAQSELRGEPVYDLKEMVELRFAGDRNYVPVFEVTEMWRNVDGRVITYAERFAEQYQAFVMGGNQVAGGTPLEMLRPYGITPAQISLCNALKIYSIEAILELRNPAALGMSSNAIMDMARKWRADKGRREREESTSRLQELEAEIARLRQAIPEKAPTPEDIEEAVKAADDEFADMNEAQIKEEIKALTGAAPRGNPSRETLVQSLRELKGAA